VLLKSKANLWKPEAKASSTTSAIDLKSIPEVILMPRLSDTMTEGVIAEWHKKPGDPVKKGDLLADIETDKATMELESYKDGTFLYAGAAKGEKIKVNDLLCIIGDEGKVDVEKIVAAAKSGGNVQAAAEASVEEPQASSKPATPESDEGEVAVGEDGRIKASPLARKLAAEKGIDLSKVKGSGDNGRIIKRDIDNYKPEAAPTKADRTAAPVVPAGQESFDEVNVSQMRKTIARRLGESKFSAPHFYLTVSIDMDNAIAARSKMNEISPVKISFNDIVLKACAIALKKHPAVNSSWRGDTIRVNHHVNIGVAVAVDEGLLVPVVRNADLKTFSQIAEEVKTFAKKAKDKKLQPSDWEGSTFTISNLGMFGIDEFTAIINPPDAAILAVGAIQQVPVVKNGQVVPGNVMKVTMSCDHRVIDGATGAAFLQTLKEYLEEPMKMFI
jgi:pyruvate dehydrogenase E2 component (dihydrolipoamide acetyltransferase)